mmetsp:Transcript_11711/g.49108  ORF Transcript_11711/g.49108 Transcript_11711/m.49108 type:complete len:227 (+) Transcript_11711:586-1266(+)
MMMHFDNLKPLLRDVNYHSLRLKAVRVPPGQTRRAPRLRLPPRRAHPSPPSRRRRSPLFGGSKNRSPNAFHRHPSRRPREGRSNPPPEGRRLRARRDLRLRLARRRCRRRPRRTARRRSLEPRRRGTTKNQTRLLFLFRSEGLLLCLRVATRRPIAKGSAASRATRARRESRPGRSPRDFVVPSSFACHLCFRSRRRQSFSWRLENPPSPARTAGSNTTAPGGKTD